MHRCNRNFLNNRNTFLRAKISIINGDRNLSGEKKVIHFLEDSRKKKIYELHLFSVFIELLFFHLDKSTVWATVSH